MNFLASQSRYKNMEYRRCGKSGLKLPIISLGLWHNFGDITVLENSRSIILKAFDCGITHFDLANNYGPPPGSAEENFGRIFKKNLKPYRDEIILSTKAGYEMWEGPYGNWGSKKYLTASLNQSLKRMSVNYVDIFYHHRPDPDTPIEETVCALDLIVRQGKALYIGLSNYKLDETKKALKLFRESKTPFIIHQPSYSMLNRWIEDELLNFLINEGIGIIVFKPLEQGLLTNKYLKGIPEDSRAAGQSVFLSKDDITQEVINKVKKLNEIASKRNQTLAQMALAWILRKGKVTSALIGASKVEQINDNVQVMGNLDFSEKELDLIDEVLKGK